jgi:undecaprenyl-diphosphatase
MDTSIFLWINGLSGHVRFIDEFFKGFANDYFALVVCMLVCIWLWFVAKDPAQRERNQRTILITMISVGMASWAMAIINGNLPYFPRPFEELGNQVNVVFYHPIDSSFPSNYAAVIWSFAFPLLIRARKYGIFIGVLAFVGSFGRIYMGVHYPLDILGGIGVGLLGCGLAFFLSWALKWFINLVMKILRFLSFAG